MNITGIIIQELSRKEIDRCTCPKCRGCAGTATVCFNSRKMASRTAGNALVKAVGLLLLLGCFLLQGQAIAGVTNPAMEPARLDSQASFGYLRVFSSTQESQWGEGSYYYLHTGYRIYDSTGKVVKWVENYDSSTDETPEKVELAPGRYTIWAQSDKDGYVKVPIVITPYQTALIHLESDQEEINPAQAITTSSGKVVGWKA
jgi:hypothetical protein